MTVTTTTLGSNSKTISLDNATQAEVITAISAILTASGWSIWDQVSTTNCVYRSPCYDGVNYKYLQLNCSSTTALVMSVWEGWNNATHVGTNQAQIGVSASATLTIAMSACNISIFSSSHYAFFTVNNAVTYSGGVFEFYRDNPSDLPSAGFPNYFACWYGSLNTSNGTVGASPDPNVAIANGNGTVGGVPRNRYGDTGFGANNGNALLSINGLIGGYNGVWNSGPVVYSSGAVVPNGTSTGQSLAATPVFINNICPNPTVLGGASVRGKFDYRGRVFGLKMLPTGFGQYGDVTSVLCDADGFSDPSGTGLDHFILGNIAVPL